MKKYASVWLMMKRSVSFMQIISAFWNRWVPELVHFSPVHESKLPEELDGLLLCGGYPELNGEALENNQAMCSAVREAIAGECPVLQNVEALCIFIRRWRLWMENSVNSAE